MTRLTQLGATGLLLAVCTLLGRQAAAHCQIPCGIYDDDTRVRLMAEHITTIEKSMKQIVELSAQEKMDHNQMVRWVLNKEDHAAKLTEIVTYYFMAQRVKPVDEQDKEGHAAYVRQVTLLHRILVAAMKAKQTTDLEYVSELRRLLEAFTRAYEGLSTAH